MYRFTKQSDILRGNKKKKHRAAVLFFHSKLDIFDELKKAKGKCCEISRGHSVTLQEVEVSPSSQRQFMLTLKSGKVDLEHTSWL